MIPLCTSPNAIPILMFSLASGFNHVSAPFPGFKDGEGVNRGNVFDKISNAVSIHLSGFRESKSVT